MSRAVPVWGLTPNNGLGSDPEFERDRSSTCPSSVGSDPKPLFGARPRTTENPGDFAEQSRGCDFDLSSALGALGRLSSGGIPHPRFPSNPFVVFKGSAFSAGLDLGEKSVHWKTASLDRPIGCATVPAGRRFSQFADPVFHVGGPANADFSKRVFQRGTPSAHPFAVGDFHGDPCGFKRCSASVSFL